jgi:hypothetical protein
MRIQITLMNIIITWKIYFIFWTDLIRVKLILIMLIRIIRNLLKIYSFLLLLKRTNRNFILRNISIHYYAILTRKLGILRIQIIDLLCRNTRCQKFINFLFFFQFYLSSHFFLLLLIQLTNNLRESRLFPIDFLFGYFKKHFFIIGSLLKAPKNIVNSNSK